MIDMISKEVDPSSNAYYISIIKSL